MTGKCNDIAAVVATSDYAAARSWYSRVVGREPDLEPVDGVAEWQIATNAWLQLVDEPARAGKSAVRFGVDSLDTQIANLKSLGIATVDPMVVADTVRILDIADPDGNEVSFVEDISGD